MQRPDGRRLRRLHNESWGFETNCFVCEPRNGGGLQIPFHHDLDTDTVVADFTLSETFSGAPTYLHGGVILAVLDEAMAWATIALAGRFAFTAETTTKFLQPVRVGEPHSVEARLRAYEGERIDTSAEVRDGHGELCATATASFSVLGVAQAIEATGADEAALDATYLR